MSFTSVTEPQPSLAWQFENSNVDSVTNLQPSSQVSPGPAQLQGSAALVTNAPTSNTAVYFPGTTGSYMNLGASSPVNVNLTTSNIFVECWVYLNSGVGFPPIINLGTSGQPWWNWSFSFNSSSLYPRLGMGYNANNLTSSVAITGFQTWAHVAFSYDYTTTKAYIFANGQYGGQMTTGTQQYFSTERTLIGGYANQSNPDVLLNGYIRDLRVVQGGVVPTTSFTPGAAPFSYASPGYVASMNVACFTLLGQFVTYNPSGKYGASAIMRNLVTRYTWPFTPSINSGVTISFWIKFDNLAAGISGSSGSSFGDRYYSFINGTPRFELVFVDNTFSYKGVTSSVVPSISTWYHVTYVFGNGSISQYINGSINGTRSDTPQTGLVFDTNLAFGGLAGSTTGTAKFELDDLRVYNTALTAAQVQSVYSSQGAPAPGPVMPQPRYAWDFNGTTTDYVSGLTGTTTGSVSYNSAGKYGQSLVIKNPTTGPTSANNINWITNSTFNMDAGFSVCFWLKVSTIPATDQSVIFFTNNSIIDYRYYISVGTNSTLSFYFYNNSTFMGPTSYTLSTNTWLHVVAQTVGGSMQFYINGTLFSSSAYAPSGCTLNAGLWLGGIGNYGPTNAEYDDLRIYNTALTSIQVNDIYNQQGVPGRAVVVSNKRAPGSTAIYSTNWVNPSYSGAIVNVERASDGTVSDFYVDKSGNFTQSSGTPLASWLGGAQANVLIWYDQSGAGRNAIKDNTTIYGRAPQLVVDPAGSGKYVIYFPNQNSTGTNYYGFRISAQTTASMMCRFYVKSGKINDAGWESLLCTNYDNQGVRFAGLNMNTGDGNDFLNPGGFAIYDGTYKNTQPFLTATRDSWHTMMATRASGSLNMEYIGQCNASWNSGIIIQRSLYGYMTDMVTFTAPSGPSDYSAYFASPTTTLTSAPLFNQLSPAATSSAVGAFSLRAVNGVSTRAVNVAPGGAFPPAAMTSAVVQAGNQFTQTLTGYPFTGSYTANCSSFYTPSGTEQPWKCFDKNNSGTTWTTSGAPYSSGAYTGSISTTISGSAYLGEWIQIQLPVAIVLTSYTIYVGNSLQRRAPNTFKVAGSTDGTTWTIVDTQTGITLTTSQTFTPTPQTNSYTYYRLCVNIIQGAAASEYLTIGEMVLNGTVPSLAQDFYADERGNLLTAPVTGTTLQNWLGGTTGYVTTWYDQSGRGNHMAQTTASLQPVISLATSPPSILFTGNGTTSGQYFQNTIPFTFNFGTNSQYSIRAVVNNTVGGVLVYKGKQGAPWNGNGEKAWYLGPSSLTSTSGNYPDLVGFAEGWVITSTPITSSKTSVTWASSSFSSVAVYENASSVTPSYTRASQLSDASNYLYFGITTASGVPYYNGNIYEIEIFSTPLSASDVTIMG